MNAIERYVAPQSLEEAAGILAGGGVTILAGGTDLMPQSHSGKVKFKPVLMNIRRVGELTSLGLMTPAGAAAFARRDPERSALYSFERRARTLDADAEHALRRNAKAWAFWNAQRPSYQRMTSHWVMSAKRAETRAARLATLKACCVKGEWVPPLRAAQPARSKPAVTSKRATKPKALVKRRAAPSK